MAEQLPCRTQSELVSPKVRFGKAVSGYRSKTSSKLASRFEAWDEPSIPGDYAVTRLSRFLSNTL
mgnify:CR=1 FL=1